MARILHIDDEPVVRLVVQTTLKTVGHVVVSVPRAEEGLALLTGGELFDLILLDLWLPGMDGNGFLEALRDHANHPPVLLMTGFTGDLRDPDRVVAVIEKPPASARLLSEIHRALNPKEA